MILDRLFSGILDQGKGHLIVFEPTREDATFNTGSDILSNVGLVVEALSGRAKGLNKVVHVPVTAPATAAKAAKPVAPAK